jgi:hypothetical protein
MSTGQITSGGWRNGSESGVAMIVVMMFALVFLALGAALFVLVRTSQTSTELERKEVKSFNVAEAGLDAGMLQLKLTWPRDNGNAVTVDEALVESRLQAANPGLRSPRISDEFIDVMVYDNVDADGVDTSVPYPEAPSWDSNGDGRMFVDSRANVDNDRHRIVILAERHIWEFNIPGRAMFASSAGANGQGLRVYMDPLSPAPPGPVLASWITEFGKGVETGTGITPDGPGSAITFDQILPPQYINALLGIAQNQGTYFTTGADATTFLTSGNAGGKIVYVKAASALTIGGSSQMGTRTNPIVLIVDAPGDNVIDWRGTADFYGIVIVLGNALIRGTTTIWGACLTSGLLEGKGAGSSPEIAFNQNVINLVNHQYIMSVNIVPNTWEEYTISPDATN